MFVRYILQAGKGHICLLLFMYSEAFHMGKDSEPQVVSH